MFTKISVQHINLTRTADGKTFTVSGYDEASSLLQEWVSSPGKVAAGSLCDFVVTYEDGNAYRGAYVMPVEDGAVTDLRSFVQDSVAFRSGRKRPASMTEAEYRKFHSAIPGFIKVILLSFSERYAI